MCVTVVKLGHEIYSDDLRTIQLFSNLNGNIKLLKKCHSSRIKATKGIEMFRENMEYILMLLWLQYFYMDLRYEIIL
jgi:hypothetical protein